MRRRCPRSSMGSQQPAKHVARGRERMAKQHAGSSVAHDSPNAITMPGIMALDRTATTRRFLVSKRAHLDSETGVTKQLRARLTELSSAAIAPAVELDHQPNGRHLTLRLARLASSAPCLLSRSPCLPCTNQRLSRLRRRSLGSERSRSRDVPSR